jgi:putative flavoprotein involved in K+ transport
VARKPSVAVVGAGPAGLAAAAAAGHEGLEVEVFESAGSVATSWRTHYDRLHLHTTRRLSALPGRPIPREAGRWVGRDDLIAYLEAFAAGNRLRIRFDTKVERVDPVDGGWRLTTGAGHHDSSQVVIATGYNHTPHVPAWPGRDTFTGELLHSSAYRNPAPFRGRDVLVVGAGNSGAEIAADLVEGGARKVWISIRTPPNIVRRDIGPLANQHLGIAVHRLPVGVVDAISLILQRVSIGDLGGFGIPAPGKGAYSRVLEGQIPLIDVGFLGHLKKGEIEVVPALDRFSTREAGCGQRRIIPDAVIAATGYSRGLEPLAGHLGVLSPNGLPRLHAPRAAPNAPGLYFIGYTNPIVGNLYDISRVAHKLAGVIKGTQAAVPS